VYKSLPTLNENTRYSLSIEYLVVPPSTEGVVLNQTPLFTVERRLRKGVEYKEEHYAMPIDNATFTPSQCRTVGQLAFEINYFFRKLLLKCSTTGDFFSGDPEHFDEEVDDHFLYANNDWHTYGKTDAGYAAASHIKIIFRSDGKLGFKYTHVGSALFVLHLTEEGQRVFGFDNRYIAPDENSKMHLYLDGNYVRNDPPPGGAESVVFVSPNSIYSHNEYRPEIAIMTSLPLIPYVDVQESSAATKRQLASYRYPQNPAAFSYRETMFKQVIENTRSYYHLENGSKTHNVFFLTGTQLQNFHIRLLSRKYVYNENSKLFDMKESPYLLPDESLWTLGIKLKTL